MIPAWKGVKRALTLWWIEDGKNSEESSVHLDWDSRIAFGSEREKMRSLLDSFSQSSPLEKGSSEKKGDSIARWIAFGKFLYEESRHSASKSASLLPCWVSAARKESQLALIVSGKPEARSESEYHERWISQASKKGLAEVEVLMVERAYQRSMHLHYRQEWHNLLE